MQNQLCINGEFVDAVGGHRLPVINPHDGSVITQIAEGRQADIDLAVAAAKAAFPKWKAVAAAERGRLLLKLADALEANSEEFEQLDELSKDTLSSYLQKRGSMVSSRSKNNKGNENMVRAVNKMANKKTNEEVEQIDELSHDTLRSYVDKAKKENLPGKGGNRGVALLTPGTRDKGVHKAVDRMKKMKTNEDVELDETSHMNKPKKLKSFMAMKKEMIGKAGMTSEKKDEE